MNEKQFLKLTYQIQDIMTKIQDAIENGEKARVNYYMSGLGPVVATLTKIWKGEQMNR